MPATNPLSVLLERPAALAEILTGVLSSHQDVLQGTGRPSQPVAQTISLLQAATMLANQSLNSGTPSSTAVGHGSSFADADLTGLVGPLQGLPLIPLLLVPCALQCLITGMGQHRVSLLPSRGAPQAAPYSKGSGPSSSSSVAVTLDESDPERGSHDTEVRNFHAALSALALAMYHSTVTAAGRVGVPLVPGGLPLPQERETIDPPPSSSSSSGGGSAVTRPAFPSLSNDAVNSSGGGGLTASLLKDRAAWPSIASLPHFTSIGPHNIGIVCFVILFAASHVLHQGERLLLRNLRHRMLLSLLVTFSRSVLQLSSMAEVSRIGSRDSTLSLSVASALFRVHRLDEVLRNSVEETDLAFVTDFVQALRQALPVTVRAWKCLTLSRLEHSVAARTLLAIR